jgi:hypothetical protein
MRNMTHVFLVAAVVAVAGCASNQEPKYADLGTPTPQNPVVKSADDLTGRIASYNSIGRFAVLNFPVTRMPAVGQTLFVFRDGLKVGEVKVTGPQRDDNIVADLTKGEAQSGDQVRDR